MKKIIAIVDDEPDILSLVTLNLKKAGFEVKEFEDLYSFNFYLNKNMPDLVVLDLMLPDGDGLTKCRELKQEKRTAQLPIIMLTARGDETDKIIGLELGADDYITKPFSPKELVARVKAVLRRTEKKEPASKNIIALGKHIVIDQEKYEIYLDNEKIETTTTEFKILFYLASRPGIVFSRDQILDHLWGNEKAVIDRTIDVHIKHLREKMGKYGDCIKNVRGVGYKCVI